MVDFLKDTEDLIEKHYGSQVLNNYPVYKDIWEKIIGVREVKGLLLPWEIDFSKCILTPPGQERFKRIHEMICMAFYCQFCHLVGAHYQYEKTCNSIKLKEEHKKYFEFWESFDNFYQHLGNVRNQLFSLRDCFNSLGITNIDSSSDAIETYFNNKGKNLGSEWINITEDFTFIRNYIVHFGRIPSNGHDIFAIPYNIPNIRKMETAERPIWSDYLSKREGHVEVIFHMNWILKRLEKVLNKTNKVFLVELLDYMKNNLISFRK